MVCDNGSSQIKPGRMVAARRFGEDHIEPWLRLLDGLALSYIAALIFYIVQVYLPERNMVRKAIAANAYDFEKAIELIDVTCLLWENYTEVGNNRLKVKWNGTKPGFQLTSYALGWRLR